MIKVDILQAGTNNHGVTVDDFNAFATDFLSDGIVGAVANTAGVAPMTGAFAVNAQASPNMTVAVTQGIAYVTGTPTAGVSQRLRVVMDASQNVTINSNSTGGTRYDWIYIKLDPDKMKDPAADSSDVASLVVSRSTSNSVDNGGTMPTYGYCVAVVTVANAASSISNANIADKRKEIVPGRDGSITSDKMAEDSVVQKNLNLDSCHVYHNTVQALTSTPVALQFNTEVWDTNSMHDNATNNSRITIKTAGKYRITGQATAFDASATTLFLEIRKNGVSLTPIVIQRFGTPGTAGGPIFQINTTLNLAVNDYIELYVANTNNANTSANYCWLLVEGTNS